MPAELFIETLRVDNGTFRHPEAHWQRMASTQEEAFGRSAPFRLTDEDIPHDFRKGTVKCRILYGSRCQDISFSAYSPRRIVSLMLIEGGSIDYHLKYADRSCLDRLFSMRGSCDDILITKNGFITDTSFSNVALFDGKNFIVPSHCLLNGTARKRLLQQGKATERPVRTGDLPAFQSVFLINAMMNPEDNPSPVPVANIRSL